MSVKAILILCAQALLIQSALSYCVSAGNNYGAGLGLGYGCGAPALAAPACGTGFGYSTGLGYGGIEAIPTSGGGLPVSSVSAIAPSGLSITSENVFEGALSVAGELPFVSAVALEGAVPSGGAGAVNYSCGNGLTAIESIAPSTAAYAPGAAAYNSGLSALAPSSAIASGVGYGNLIGHGCGSGHY